MSKQASKTPAKVGATKVDVFTASDLSGKDVAGLVKNVTSTDANGLAALYASTVGAMLVRALIVLRSLTDTGDPRTVQAAKDLMASMTPAERSQATSGAKVLHSLGSRPSAESLKLAAALIRRKVNGQNVKDVEAAANAAERNAVLMAALVEKVEQRENRAARPAALTSGEDKDDSDKDKDTDAASTSTVKVIVKHAALVMADGVTLTDDDTAALASVGAALVERFAK